MSMPYGRQWNIFEANSSMLAACRSVNGNFRTLFRQCWMFFPRAHQTQFAAAQLFSARGCVANTRTLLLIAENYNNGFPPPLFGGQN